MGRIGKKIKMRGFRRWLKENKCESMDGSLFDSLVREDGSPKREVESDYEFYNRSSRKEIANVRKFIDRCFSRYPVDYRSEMESRIKSDKEFSSALFELYLHEVFVRQGCFLEPHPDLPNGRSSRPDFLVTSPSRGQFYLEAVLASENDWRDPGADARKGLFWDRVSEKPHRNFRVAVKEIGCPVNQPSSKDASQKIHAWLDSLDPDQVSRQVELEGYEFLEPFQWSQEGWEVSFFPIPLPVEKRGCSERLIAAMDLGGGVVDGWSPIRDAARKKGGKYGCLDKPLLVAINMDSFHLNEIDELQALYGQELVQVGAERVAQLVRRANGLWVGPKGPVYKRISGVLIFNDLQASNASSRHGTLYFNPWAEHVLPVELRVWPHVESDGEKLQRKEGVPLHEMLGVGQSWPE